MKIRLLSLLGVTALSLSACASTRDEPVAPAPPVGPGAIAGTIAADRNGDGIVDGYYSADGMYHEIMGPPCPPPPPPPPPSRRGERG